MFCCNTTDFKDVLVYFHQVVSSQAFTETDKNGRFYWRFMAEFLHSNEVLQIRVFLNLFYESSVSSLERKK